MTTGLTITRPMGPRDPGEPHRVATPLERLFDLVSVIAIAAAAAAFHHALAEDHAAEGLVRYLVTFLAIWWAWMNFTWFASAYDNDDAIFRLLTMVIMAGSLLLAAGVGGFFNALDLRLGVAGYVVMRLALVTLWLRAAHFDPQRRRTAYRYALGISVAQCYWIALLFITLPDGPALFGFIFLGFLIELLVPIVAERTARVPTHRHHIVERHGELMIIVLGEVLLSAVIAIRADWAGGDKVFLGHVAASALVLTFAMFWLYFSADGHYRSPRLRHAVFWVYGHFVLFAAVAAAGSGFAAIADGVGGTAHISPEEGVQAVGLAVAVFMAALWAVHDLSMGVGRGRFVLPLAAVLSAVVPHFVPKLALLAAVAVAAIILRERLAGSAAARP